jgi:hypothetical protein
MLNPREILDSVTELVPLDLVRGPFVMGSLLTHIHEAEHHEPTWTPRDLDISCRTVRQVDHAAAQLGKKFKIIKAPRYSNSTYHASLELLPGFNVNIAYSGLENFSADGYIHEFVWSTILAICTDGKKYLYHEHTLEDIKNKTLRLTSQGLIDEINFYKSIGQFNYYQQVIRPGEQLSYDKYVARGYTDPNNTVRQELWREI